MFNESGFIYFSSTSKLFAPENFEIKRVLRNKLKNLNHIILGLLNPSAQVDKRIKLIFAFDSCLSIFFHKPLIFRIQICFLKRTFQARNHKIHMMLLTMGNNF